MADTNMDSVHDLRDKNVELLNRLQSGVNTLRGIFRETQKLDFNVGGKDVLLDKKKPPLPKLVGAHSLEEKNVHLSFDESIQQGRKEQTDMAKRRTTSTPKTYTDALASGGNSRRSSRRSKLKTPRKSILRTPIAASSSKGQTPKKSHHVKFTPQTDVSRNDNVSLANLDADKSLLGYDWIAGILDNDRDDREHSDAFLKDIKEFRRINNRECSASKIPFLEFPETSAISTQDQSILSLTSADKENEDEYTCAGRLFMVDKRLQPVPIHGPDSHCPICKTKKEAQTEYDNSYIRVSVPRSTLESPYKVRPHRRKSFDPSDSVALSEHCLAGWQCSWPATTPHLASLDLRSALEKERREMAALDSNARLKTKALLDSSHAIEYDMLKQKYS